MAWFWQKAQPNEIEVVGARRVWFRDIYHFLLRIPWWADVAVIATVFVSLNALFAWGFLFTGGVAGVRTGSFSDNFFFSVQTLGTIGYGTMHPESFHAHVLVTIETLVGILVVAITTGLMFAKFSMPRSQVRFAGKVVIGNLDGVPTLMVRIGNERSSQVLEAQFHLTVTRTEQTAEGITMYRFYDLRLERQRAPALARAFLVLHRLVEPSLLAGYDAARMAKDEIELVLSVTGLDQITGQTVQAQHIYEDKDVVWGKRYADLLTKQGDRYTLDLHYFDEVV